MNTIYIYSQNTEQTTIFGTTEDNWDITRSNTLKLVSNWPRHSMLFNNNHLYIASTRINLVYKINVQTKKWSIVAGNPNKRLGLNSSSQDVVEGFSGDNGSPTNAQVGYPTKLQIDNYGSMYILCDSINRIPIDTNFGVVGYRDVNIPRLIRKVYNVSQLSPPQAGGKSNKKLKKTRKNRVKNIKQTKKNY